jgi:hypothetical protein
LVLAVGEVKGSVLPVSRLVVLEAGPGGVCCPVHLEVGGGGLRGRCQELGLSLVLGLISAIKYLKCHFHKISLGGLRTILHLFKFSLNIREGLGNKMRVENNYSILGRWV